MAALIPIVPYTTSSAGFTAGLKTLDSVIRTAAIMAPGMYAMRNRKRARSGGYGKMNTRAGMLFGRVNTSRSLTIRGVHPFRRTVQVPILYQSATGFGYSTLTADNISFQFNLTSVILNLAGSQFSIAVPGATDLSNLFDKWRIDSVSCKVFYQDTQSATASNATGMPIIVSVWDANDGNPAVLGDLLQYPGVKIYQFGNGASATGAMTTAGKPLAASITGLAAAGPSSEKHGTWLNTAVPATQYLGLKMSNDSLGATSATNGGQYSFYFTINYSCKDYN